MDLVDQTDAMQIGQVLARSTTLQTKSGLDSEGIPWNGPTEPRRYIMPTDLSNAPAKARFEEQEQKRAEEAKNRRRNSVWSELLKARGERYAKATLDQFDAPTTAHQKAKAAVEDYVANMTENLEAGRSVLFIGPAGTGKDHLSMPLCHAAIKEHKTLIWTTGTNLWLKFRDAMNSNHREFSIARISEFDYDEFDANIYGSESMIVKKLSSVDVLVISDPLPPGASLTDCQSANMLQIIDHRYSHLLPTWMTINVASRAEAEQRMGGPIVDRLCHDALVVVCDWPSYRQRKAEEAGK